MTRIKKTALLCCMLLAVLFFVFPAFAGWDSSQGNDKITYSDESGELAKGLKKIGNSTYFFDNRGCLQTGWVKTPEGFRYFKEEGKAGGELGSMLSGGVFEINGYLYGFDTEGVVLTGFHELDSGSYYFVPSEKAGECGRALKDDFKKLSDGRKVYFQEDGSMAADKWIKDKTYYVDETGNLLRNTVTKDGYVLKKNGKVKKKLSGNEFIKLSGKWYFYKKNHGLLKDKLFKYKGDHYYVDEDGVRQKGWVTVNGKDYYFGSDGKAVTGTKTINGKKYTFDKNGKLKGTRSGVDSQTDTEKEEGEEEKKESGSKRVLVMCGHGQGDSGAVGCNGKYMESAYTRDFGKRVYQELKDAGVDVHLFNTNYDMFQQMRAATGSVGSFTGSGKKKKKILNAIKKNSIIPDLTQFDYALEIHFNATGYNAKDPGGDGTKKGTGTYVNAYKPAAQRKIDKKIISALNALGLNTWGSGVYGSSGLLNARAFNEIGVNYSLLETCFIDDKDDMNFYLKKRDEMAKAVAKAVAEYLS